MYPPTAPLYATVGVEYAHQIQATDREGDLPIEYGLSSKFGSNPVINSETGVITWTPTEAGEFWLSANATDNLGNYASRNSESWTVTVLPENAALDVNFEFTPSNVIQLGETATLKVVPINVTGDAQVSIMVGGETHPINPLLEAQITPTTVGKTIVVATVSNGNETIIKETAILIPDPDDTTPPTVAFNSPQNADSVKALTEVFVTAQDDNLASVQLLMKRADQANDEYQTLYEGTSELNNQAVATFDPTMLVNGIYHLLLQATDSNNNIDGRQISLIVEGDLKVGNFSVSFEDLNLPLAGVPITVTRTYDSRRKSENLDFGYGWTVGYQNVRIDESMEPAKGWHQYISDNELYKSGGDFFTANGICIIPVGEKVITVTLPNGDVEKFRADARSYAHQSESNPNCFLTSDRHYYLEFEAMGDTKSTLATNQGLDLYLSNNENGNLTASIELGEAKNITQYTLTTQSGYVYELDQDFGAISVTTPNGHSITYSDSGIEHSNGTAITFERDAENRISAIVDPKGNRTEYTYNGAGNLTAVKDPISLAEAGTGSTYTYNSNHEITYMTDALGRRLIRNIYDDDGRLIAQEDNRGNRTDFDHNLSSRQSIVTDRDQRTKILDYDEEGNVLTEIQVASGLVYSEGIQTDYSYDTNGNQLTQAVGGAEYIHTATFDEDDNQLSQQDPLGNIVSYENYNEKGQEGRIVDEMGRAHDMGYDTHGQLLSINGPEHENADGLLVRNTATNIINDRGLVTSTTDMRGHTTTYTYYNVNHTGGPETYMWRDLKFKESTPEGGTITYTYDDNYNVATETHERTVSGVVETETVSYDYDALDRLIKTIYPDGTNTETEFDLAGNVIRTKDRFNHWTETDFDPYRREIETRYPDSSKEKKTYTNEGLLFTHTGRNNTVMRYEYDDFGRQWKVYNGATYTETQYTPQGWVQFEWDENRNLTEYTYDLAGRRESVIRHGQEGTDTVTTHSFAYYPNGELESETDALGRTTTYTLNALDQRVETVYHDLSSMQTQFDSMGARTRSIDQNNKATRFDYDGLGRLSGVQPEVNIESVPVPITSYTYDQVGNKLTQTDAKGNTTTWTYDYYGRVLTRTLPEGQVESFVYDDVNRITIHTDFNGDSITTQMDNMDRAVSTTYSKDGKQEAYTYTVDGQVETIVTTLGADTETVSYTYTNNNQLYTETQADGTILTYTYDNIGNRTRVNSRKPGQQASDTHYTYDGFNRLKDVTDSNGFTTYTYDAVGNLDTVVYPNGLITDYTYNELNQLEAVITKDVLNNILSSYTYGLEATGRRETITEETGRVTAYGYDELYRLTSENITDSTNGNYFASYQYDIVGNRTYETVNGVQTAYTYDNNDRLTQTGGTAYTHDSNGNTLTETLDLNTKTYSWDGKNKLTSLDNVGATVSYTYNPSGIRTSKTEAGTTTHFVVDANRDYAQVLEEVEAGATTVSYTYGHDLLSQERGGSASFYHYDGLASTRALSDASGSLTDTYDYEAFGEVLNQTGTTENNYLFTGEQFDRETKNYYLRARYMNPANGNMLSMDTWAGKSQSPITLNKYLYAGADPVSYVDPSGNTFMGSISAMNIMGILAATSAAAIGINSIDFSNSTTTDEFGFSSPQKAWLLLATMAGSGSSLLSLATSKLEEDTSGSVVMYHGASVDSLVSLLNGAPLSAAAAQEQKFPGEGSALGFFLTPDIIAAEFFGQRRGGGVIQYTFTTAAFNAISAGSTTQPIPPIGNSTISPGTEMIVLPMTFPLFDSLRESGQITASPAH